MQTKIVLASLVAVASADILALRQATNPGTGLSKQCEADLVEVRSQSDLPMVPTQVLQAAVAPTAAAVIPDEYLPPNKILFLQNVPDEYDVEALTGIFGRFDGFREVRLVPGRRGIAFVEYDAEQGAIAAKENTAGMTLGDKNIKVTYQRQ
ncbi:hypothetical protein NLG97_g7322 [Lecanicillium saksenae]|uniref:Uncharacterized protein n=1 Tax=Lecanicillium saksenae TaxID=468837 RepID=A0ACC1QM91_9HYPO|nr:hypothetical protein NLG97_g7322 [Lecanicillium saksenae]